MPHRDERSQQQDPRPDTAPPPDPVTGSTENTTGTDQAAENRENESPA